MGTQAKAKEGSQTDDMSLSAIQIWSLRLTDLEYRPITARLHSISLKSNLSISWINVKRAFISVHLRNTQSSYPVYFDRAFQKVSV